jgi:carbamoyl-phosphate synthase large subunit
LNKGNSKIRVLVFPGGSEIGNEIWRSLKDCKDIELFSAADKVSNHAPYIFKHHFIVPSVSNPRWLGALNGVIRKNRIDYLYPAHDEAIYACALEREKIKAKVVSPPPATCLITRFKSKTYQRLKGVIPVPHLYPGPKDVRKLPVFIKPDRGQGSSGAKLIAEKAALQALGDGKGFVIMEYLPGKEYTVDCFSDRKAGLLFTGGRERIRTKSGISMNSRPIRNPVFRKYAEKISAKLPLYGAWFFQLKEDAKGVLKLLEVAPRIAGTQSLHRVVGINFPLLSIYEQERIPLSILENKYEVEVDRALVNRYRHSLKVGKAYVDLDDTLVQNGRVNIELIRLLYQFVNSGVQIILLTRHKGDLARTLEKYRLSKLFDSVIWVSPGKEKYEFIQGKGAILIDDSFSERLKTQRRLGIPTFDCSMIEMLLDEKA